MRLVEWIGFTGVALLLAWRGEDCSIGRHSTPAAALEAPRPAHPPTIRFDPGVLERLGVRIAPAGSFVGEPRLHLRGNIERAPGQVWVVVAPRADEKIHARVGAEVDVLADTEPGHTVRGRVSVIEEGADGAARARISVEDGSELRDAAEALVSIHLPDATNDGRLLVPAEAVQEIRSATAKPKSVVFVSHQPGELEVRDVEIARRSGQVTEIAAGLARGEPIVVERAFLLGREAVRQ